MTTLPLEAALSPHSVTVPLALALSTSSQQTRERYPVREESYYHGVKSRVCNGITSNLALAHRDFETPYLNPRACESLQQC